MPIPSLTPVLDNTELEKFLSLSTKFREKTGTEIPPTLFVKFQDEKSKNAFIPMSEFFSRPDEKRVGMASIGAILTAKFGAIDKATLISEIWYTRISAKDAKRKEVDLAELPLPSQDPDRKEALMMITRDSQGGLETKLWNFKKGQRGQLTLEKENDFRKKGMEQEDNLLVYLFFPHLAEKEALAVALAKGLISESQFEEVSKKMEEVHRENLS